MILVSACLLGCNCRYDGKHNRISGIIDLKKTNEIISVCPEEIGGLATPRSPSEIKIINGRIQVITKDGNDVTAEFIKGAQETLKIIEKNNIKFAILKSNSPSCGYGRIYDGSFSKKLIEGNGITAQIIKESGLEVQICDENNYVNYIK